MDREFFDKTYNRMIDLFPFCQDQRYLVHADYAFGNIIVHKGKVTAVLDWANAMYGDFLYDVAWMDLRSPEQDYRILFKRYYEDKGTTIKDYEERLLCYEYYVSLEPQVWYGLTNNPADYAWMRERSLQITERGITRA